VKNAPDVYIRNAVVGILVNVTSKTPEPEI